LEIAMATLLVAGMVLLVVASLVPSVVLGFRDSLQRGRHASEREAWDPYFWATVGLAGYIAYLIEKVRSRHAVR
jgi:hypothetical protein